MRVGDERAEEVTEELLAVGLFLEESSSDDAVSSSLLPAGNLVFSASNSHRPKIAMAAPNTVH